MNNPTQRKKLGTYIGVTGFMSLSEVVACDNAFREAVRQLNNPDVANEMKFMIGILLSSKTLSGAINRWFNRYPTIFEIPEIISGDFTHHLRTIHYNTDEPQTIDEQIDQVMCLSPNIDAIQLNIKWASHVKLQRISRKYPTLRIILQIGGGALAEVDEPGDIFLGEALKAYSGVVDDFLVDPSGGKGDLVDIWRAFACISDDDMPKNIHPGVAGGFHADNIYKIIGLMRRLHRPVNIDAEGRLRTDTEGGGRLIVPEAQRYIKTCVHLIGGAMAMEKSLELPK